MRARPLSHPLPVFPSFLRVKKDSLYKLSVLNIVFDSLDRLILSLCVGSISPDCGACAPIVHFLRPFWAVPIYARPLSVDIVFPGLRGFGNISRPASAGPAEVVGNVGFEPTKYM